MEYQYRWLGAPVAVAVHDGTIVRLEVAGIPDEDAIMSQVKIKQVGPDQAPLVLELVGKLLTELGEEGEDTGPLDVDKLTASCWRRSRRWDTSAAGVVST